MGLRRGQAMLAPVVLVTAGASAAVLPAAGPDRPGLGLSTSAPLFSGPATRDLRPGDRVRSCITVRNVSDAATAAALYSTRSDDGLAPFLELTVTEGSEHGPRCAGFVPRRKLFAGLLSDFPRRLDDALVVPDVLDPRERRGLRFELALVDDAAAAGRTVSWDWRLAARALPASIASRACARARTRRDRIIRTRPLSSRVSTVLVLRGFGRPGADRLVLTTGLRVRGRTLLVPRWARVTYRVNGRALATAQQRPFRVRVPPARLRAGVNRVSVTVQPRRGRTRTTTFTARVERRRDACVAR